MSEPTSWLMANVWLIPAVPLGASLAILIIHRSFRRSAAALAVLGQLVAAALAVALLVPTLSTPGFRQVRNFVWFTFGHQELRLGWLIDPLAVSMLLMVTTVGTCIFIFSIGYMAGDRNFSRFFAYLSFFSSAMLGLVIANSLLLLFVCWELVGLASYLLIGFWIHKPSAAAAAKKAFITTRIGDLAFFLGLLWLYHRGGSLLFYDGGKGCIENATLLMMGTGTTSVALLIFCGAIGKSGQFPLHVWLPDAMEGPTPVSALIHAATMVAAGVFLVARMYPLFAHGGIDGVTPSLTWVVWIGVITSLMAALIAVGQMDIKRILAYSTVSQLGLMMVSLGVGGVIAGMLHLLAHGFFKALLFLGAGSVIHGSHHEQDIRKMGGLRKMMPVTFFTYAIGMLSLSGVPLLFSGAWTKEEILRATGAWPQSHWPHYFVLAGVFLTAFYMTRQMIYVFFGQSRTSENAHESPRVMTLPLVVLGAATIALSVLLTPVWPWLNDYLSGIGSGFHSGEFISPMVFISLALIAAGVGLGLLLYRNSGQRDGLQQIFPALYRFLENKMWIDELYARTIVAFAKTASHLSDWMDRYFWDGLVRLFGGLGQVFGSLTRTLDERGINARVDQGALGARGTGRLISKAHSGQIQTYLAAIALGLFALLILYAWLA